MYNVDIPDVSLFTLVSRTQYRLHLPVLYITFLAYSSLCLFILLQFGVFFRFLDFRFVLMFCIFLVASVYCIGVLPFWRNKE